MLGGANAQPLLDRGIKVADRNAAHGGGCLGCLHDLIIVNDSDDVKSCRYRYGMVCLQSVIKGVITLFKARRRCQGLWYQQRVQAVSKVTIIMQLLLSPHPMIAAAPDMPTDLRAGIEALRIATGHFLVVAHRYEMYRALARDKDFFTRINQTTAADGLNTVRGALVSSLVVSLAASDAHPCATGDDAPGPSVP